MIVNNGAGTGRAARVWGKTEEILKEKGIPYEAWITTHEKHGMELARQICEQNKEEKIVLLVVGGDGTLNEVLNGITDFDRILLGVIPTGSGNDFARNLGISKHTEETLEEILSYIEKEEAGEVLPRIDLGEVIWDGCVEPRIFGISAGIGLDAIVCKKALHSSLKKVLNRFRLGKLTYLMLTVQTLFSMKTFDCKIQSRNEEKIYHKMIFAAVMNLRAEGGGVPMVPNATPYDGMLSMGHASGIPKWKTFFLLPLLALGKQERIREFFIEEALVIKVETDQPVVLHADGEYCGEIQKAEFRCLEKKLWLLHKATR